MSSRTNRPIRRIDDKSGVTLGGGGIIETGDAPAAPGVTVLGAPTGLRVVNAALLTSALTPAALVNLEWRRPATPGPVASYLVQWSLASNFTNPTGIPAFPNDPQAPVVTFAISPLPVGTLVYFRVAAIAAGGVQGAWSAGVSTTTPADTTPPAAPTSLITSWSGLTGDLDIRWANPTSTNFAYVRVQIYASNGGALLRTERSVTGRYVWTRAQQYADTAGAYDASVYLVLYAVSVGGTLSTTALTGTATLAVPTTPAGLTSSWAGDTGTAAADLLITWTASSAVALYRLSIDGVARDVVGGRHVYTLDNNRAEHSGTPDAALSLSLVAVDALGQSSTAATQTATNAAPPASTISVFAAFFQVGLTIGASAAQDLLDYRVRVYKAGVLVRTFYTAATNLTYTVEDGSGSYTFDVAVRDRFGQVGTASAQTAPATVEDQSQFLADLRAGVTYRDSLSTSPTTLNGLKDDNTGTNVVTYTSSTPWRWTEAIRALAVRHRKTTLSTSASAAYYVGISADGTTYTWYAGGTATGGVWAPVAQASEAAAQAAATTLAAGVWLVTLAATVEGRYFRLGHRNTGASYALREFYPRSLIEADDIRVESLSALSANLGSITAGTITGLTIQTATSGARVVIDSSGLKTYNSAGTLVVQATTATGGAINLYGNGADGIAESLKLYNAVGDAEPAAYVGMIQGTAQLMAPVNGAALSTGYDETTGARLNSAGAIILLAGNAATASDTLLRVDNTAAFGRVVNISGHGLRVGAFTGTAPVLAEGFADFTGGINVGAASGAAAGQVKAQGSAALLLSATVEDAVTNAATRVLGLTHNSTGTPAAGFGGSIRFGLETTTTADQLAAEIVAQWATATHASRAGALVFQAADSAGVREGLRIEASGSAALLGFFGAGAVAKPTVTGSRGGNAALASLLTALANLGLITNSSSA